MKPLKDFLVKVDKSRRDTIELDNGNKIYLSPVSYQGYDIQTRFGEVIAVPEVFNVNVQKGDTVFFHHNITKETQFYGNKIYSDFKIKDNIYRIPVTEVYGYIRDGEFYALDPYVFVEPEETGESNYGQIILPSKEKVSTGKVKHTNETLEKQGVEVGDRVMFTNHSKYQLGINDNNERIFRMQNKWLIAKLS